MGYAEWTNLRPAQSSGQKTYPGTCVRRRSSLSLWQSYQPAINNPLLNVQVTHAILVKNLPPGLELPPLCYTFPSKLGPLCYKVHVGNQF